eukprot:Blabericola_migrator_1__749@NODE_1186_length_5187_cov_125_914258_g807_i0_p1_GENE_NODE_1186_length_5187_cov_125_914258_g807_i0NODE_1186_length_5187_cov_125_914258_g807_i0_p1_ORF_typecomplete_len443_score77_67_NODE_1186_length_5187_cov_125_914258_g807_i0421370
MGSCSLLTTATSLLRTPCTDQRTPPSNDADTPTHCTMKMRGTGLIIAVLSCQSTLAQITYLTPPVSQATIIPNKYDLWRQTLTTLWPSSLLLSLSGRSPAPAVSIFDQFTKPEPAQKDPLPNADQLTDLIKRFGLPNLDALSEDDLMQILRRLLGLSDAETLDNINQPTIGLSTMRSPDLSLHQAGADLKKLLEKLPMNQLLKALLNLSGDSGTPLNLPSGVEGRNDALGNLLQDLNLPDILAPIKGGVGGSDRLGAYGQGEGAPGYGGPGYGSPGYGPGGYPRGYGSWKRGKKSDFKVKKKEKAQLDPDLALALADKAVLQGLTDNMMTPFWLLERGGDFNYVADDIFKCVLSKREEIGAGRLIALQAEKIIKSDSRDTKLFTEMALEGMLMTLGNTVVPTAAGRIAMTRVEGALRVCYDEYIATLKASLRVKQVDWRRVL